MHSAIINRLIHLTDENKKWMELINYVRALKAKRHIVCIILLNKCFFNLEKSIKSICASNYNHFCEGHIDFEEEVILSFLIGEKLVNRWLLSVVNKFIKKTIMEEIVSDKRLSVLIKCRALDWLKHIEKKMINHPHLAYSEKDRLFIKIMLSDFVNLINLNYFKTKISVVLDHQPDPAVIEDLKECTKTMGRHDVRHIFRNLITERLLNISYGTMDILSIFSQLHQFCTDWDDSGELFSDISNPMKDYLKSKSDVIPCLVRKVASEQSILDFAQDAELPQKSDCWMNEELDPEDQCILTPSGKKTKINIVRDILQIYGSTTEFVNEYCSQMTNRLLKLSTEESLARECEQINLLRRNFGSTATQKCSIMLEDLKKSAEMNHVIRRVNYQIMQSEVEFEAQLLTPSIWDVSSTSPDNTFKIPPQIQQLMECFTREYTRLKKLRELEWLHHLSMAEVELTFHNTTHTLWCPAFHALLLQVLTENSGSLTIDRLSSLLAASYEKTKVALQGLVKEGFVKMDQQNTYKLVEIFDGEHNSSNRRSIQAEDEVNLGRQETRAYELVDETWPFIQGMLTNLGSMNAERIYSSLKMFAFDQRESPFSIDDLKSYLQAKAKEGVISMEHNNYSLPNKS